MDHLSVPASTQRDGIEPVPYVARQKYDGGPFLTYPRRVSPPKPYFCSPSTLQITYGMIEQEITTEELESLFQTWLYFGLLHEMFGELFRYEDFLERPNAGSTTVTAQKLDSLVDSLKSELESCSLEALGAREQHMDECLQATYTVLSTVDPEEFHSSFNSAIRYSICFLAHSIEKLYKVRITRFNQESNIQMKGWRNLVYDISIKQYMTHNGWCPSQIDDIFEHSPNLETFWYLSKLRKTKDIGKHDYCDSKSCRAFQIDYKSYKSKHTRPGCSCPDFVVDRTAVDQILTDGSYPILRIRPNGSEGQATIQIERADAAAPYIAISHVWADGMGNPHRNALPSCWLMHVRQLSIALFSNPDYCLVGKSTESPTPSSNDETDSQALASQQDLELKSPAVPDVWVWIDTLCCPTEPPALKTLAIEKMKDVYCNARDVLVMDAALQQLRGDELDEIEIWFHIITSNWARRLWTTQEGYLAQRLWFQFAEGASSAKTLMDYLLLKSQAREEIYNGCLVETSKIWPIRAVDRIGIRFYDAGYAILGRSVSVPSDEPLCLATLLGLDLEKVAKHCTELETGMCKVWELGCAQHEISQNVVFHRGKRLHQRGFRWAPRSLLDLKYHGLQILRGPRQGQLTNAGLAISASGFTFEKREAKVRWPHEVSSALKATEKEIAIRTGIDGLWLGSLLANGEWESRFTHIRNQTQLPQIKGTIILQNHTLKELLAYKCDELAPALLGYTLPHDLPVAFHSMEPCYVYVLSPDHSNALERIYQLLLEAPKDATIKEDMQDMLTLAAGHHASEEDTMAEMMKLVERMQNFLMSKTQEEVFISATSGRFDKLEGTILPLLYRSAGLLESFDEKEWVVD